MVTAPLGKRVDTLFQFQSSYPAYPVGAWQPLTLYTAGPSETRGLLDDPLLGRLQYNGRDPGEPSEDLPVTDGAVEVPLCLREIGFWLKALLGAPVTSGSTDKTHVFESGKDTIPAFTMQHKLASADYRAIRGLKANSLDLRAEKAGGFARVTLGLMGRDEALGSAALSGTTAAVIDLLRPAASRAIVRWNNVAAADCMAASMSLSNNCTKDMSLNGSEYPADIDPDALSLSGDVTMRYRDQTWASIGAAGTYGKLEIEFAMPGALAATRKITFEMPDVRLQRTGLPIAGPGVMTSTFRFAPKVGATTPALKVSLLNDVASY